MAPVGGGVVGGGGDDSISNDDASDCESMLAAYRLAWDPRT